MADITTGTTATTTQAEEIVVGGIWTNTTNTTTDVGNVDKDQVVGNGGVEQLVSFIEIKGATGAYHGTLDWSVSTPLANKYTGCIATYKEDTSAPPSFKPKIIMIN